MPWTARLRFFRTDRLCTECCLGRPCKAPHRISCTCRWRRICRDRSGCTLTSHFVHSSWCRRGMRCSSFALLVAGSSPADSHGNRARTFQVHKRGSARCCSPHCDRDRTLCTRVAPGPTETNRGSRHPSSATRFPAAQTSARVVAARVTRIALLHSDCSRCG